MSFEFKSEIKPEYYIWWDPWVLRKIETERKDGQW